jgi:16S rRNA (cytidine1402-2'-O)-methyltransferase
MIKTRVNIRGTQSMLGKSALYVVATPIGNLNDISLRALDILKTVDVVAVEHIQNSKYLLMTHGISVPLISLHQHNEVEVTNKILTLLAEGKNVALITDAGTPAISDPGAILVQQIRAKGYPVIPIQVRICNLCVIGGRPTFFLLWFCQQIDGASVVSQI